ncbi:MAG: MtnX-like HAD-IB family phosphatase [Syntrophaceae bacterium]
MGDEFKERGGLPPLVICDFDGTISRRDVGHEVLKHFSGSRWVEIDTAYRKGEMGSMDAYTLIASFIKIDPDELRSFLDSHAELDPGFKKFYEFCDAAGMDVKIVSDGLDFYIQDILSRNGLAQIDYYANSLVIGDDHSVSIGFPHSNGECRKCGTCKSNILAALKDKYSRVIYIGDGYSDVCPAKSADLVFGKKTLYLKCRENGTDCILYSAFETIHDILKNGNHERQPQK